MGSKVAELVAQAQDLDLVGGIERKGHPNADSEISTGSNELRVAGGFRADVPPAELLVDFTNAETTTAVVEFCTGRGMALVSGTTGHGKEEMTVMKRASEEIPILFSPNMSVGITLLAKILPGIVRSLGPDCDIELVEKHHREKRDSPSGTALRLAASIAEAGRKGSKPELRHGRNAGTHQRDTGEVFIHSVRVGGIVGEHTVVMGLRGERIEVKHAAESRDCFAHGTLAAVRFLLGKPAGWYTMEDVVSLPAE
jgi:4-hydroxy-tetrahydrodipicolinate reductase